MAYRDCVMAKFRKKQIIVEAYQITDELIRSILFSGVEYPRGLELNSANTNPSERKIYIWSGTVTTIHRQKTKVVIGDWIIAEPDGKHFYPCKPDIFTATYEDAVLDHKQRHIFLHECFDELLADMIQHTDMLPSTTTVKEFIEWSYQQTISPTEVKEDG